MRTAIAAAVLAMFAGTVSASAADIAARPYTKAPIIAPGFSWTGMYVGVNAGVGGDRTDYGLGVAGTPLAAIDLTSFGGFGGGQIGYNWQFGGNWVVGLEADIQGTNMKSELNATLGPLSISTGTEMKYFGTVRGRFGYTFDRLLVYGTGGYAYGSEDTKLNINPALLNFTRSSDLSGWTAGGGVEWAMTNNLSLKTEYLYMEFDRNNVFTTGPLVIDNKVTAHTMKFGVNYAFWK